MWQNTLNEDFSVDISLDFFEADGDLYIRSGEEFREYAYPLDLIKEWLNEAEFEVLDIFDDMSLEPVGETSERAVIAARYMGKRI